MKYNSGRLIAEKLKMSDHTGQHVVLCPFHRDSDKSFSLDLDKGVFFCHGGCDEPKGGGVVEFLVKWAKIVDQKPITKREAQRQLHRTFSVPNAKTLLREALIDDLRIFMFFFPHYLADKLREDDREISIISAWQGEREYAARLEELYKRHALYEWAYSTLSAAREPNDAVAEVFYCFKALWDAGLAEAARANARERARRTRMTRRIPTRTIRTPVAPQKGDTCLVNQSDLTKNSRTIPQRTRTTRTPVPSPTKRTPV